MLEVIGLSLVKTLVSFLFGEYVLNQSTIDVGGAPSWYEKRSDSDKLYAYTYADGDLSAIDIAKGKAKTALVKEIRYAMDSVVAEHFSRLEGDEKALVGKMKDDSKLSGFVSVNMVVSAIEYDEEIKRAFVGTYLTKEQIEAYSTARVYQIKKELLNLRADSMMDELEKETNQPTQVPRRIR